eukprot:547179-Ditylum_brightwellii.AAC.1
MYHSNSGRQHERHYEGDLKQEADPSSGKNRTDQPCPIWQLQRSYCTGCAPPQSSNFGLLPTVLPKWSHPQQ